MGQYYNIIIKKVGEKKVHTFDRHINGEYTMAKLMEHSWYLNDMVNSVSEKLYKTPSHIAWVGDYASGEAGDNESLYKQAWKRKAYEMLNKTEFTLNNKYLINHTKKLILDCWEYLCKCIKANEEGWVPHPLPLLTALGNGRGGGDYRGMNNDKVGSWAWDVLEIVEWEDAAKLKKEGYQEFSIIFAES